MIDPFTKKIKKNLKLELSPKLVTSHKCKDQNFFNLWNVLLSELLSYQTKLLLMKSFGYWFIYLHNLHKTKLE